MPLPAASAAYEASLAIADRHALGAHYTREPDIMRIVGPTIADPWSQRIDAAQTREQLKSLHIDLQNYHVLDPACGSGNFLYVAFQVLISLESDLLARIKTWASDGPRAASTDLGPAPSLRISQLHGIDLDPRAAELARTTLRQLRAAHDDSDADITVADALFAPWPPVSAIVGNPPFLDPRRLAAARPDLDLAALRRAFKNAIPGRADLCVYFFRKAHDHLRIGQRAGLVGTNTIRQNYSREGGLDHILANGGTITDAVTDQVWPGDAAVCVSIVNWIKGPHTGPCTLSTQRGDKLNSPWLHQSVRRISSSLSSATDVSQARTLLCNTRPFCFEGIQPGHRGFRLTAAEYQSLLRQDPGISEVVHPYLNGDDLLSGRHETSPEYLIDLTDHTHTNYPVLLSHLERTVLPDWRHNAAKERQRTGRDTGEHQNRLRTWWQLKRPRTELQRALRGLPRYIACSRVTRRPIFASLSTTIKPDSSLTIFTAADDYTFGILQSSIHWSWFQARCSTLKGDPRYTSNTVFDTFPWPQAPSLADIQTIAAASLALRNLRTLLQKTHACDLRTLHKHHAAALHPAQDALDAAVRSAYGISKGDDILAALLALNLETSRRESDHLPVLAPGLPPSVP